MIVAINVEQISLLPLHEFDHIIRFVSWILLIMFQLSESKKRIPYENHYIIIVFYP